MLNWNRQDDVIDTTFLGWLRSSSRFLAVLNSATVMRHVCWWWQVLAGPQEPAAMYCNFNTFTPKEANIWATSPSFCRCHAMKNACRFYAFRGEEKRDQCFLRPTPAPRIHAILHSINPNLPPPALIPMKITIMPLSINLRMMITVRRDWSRYLNVLHVFHFILKYEGWEQALRGDHMQSFTLITSWTIYGFKETFSDGRTLPENMSRTHFRALANFHVAQYKLDIAEKSH